ncbi:hypothetical protein Q7C36_006644 [Tachysurus vachellii]|uniref:Uncharacterized protein n=1 Tax=Tachysurus vachellii TaxID=175792 RepID=A0AA88ND52_TACVA|nr:hypothetical protein Q7C36_006644 [Tachysurus vachellii]
MQEAIRQDSAALFDLFLHLIPKCTLFTSISSQCKPELNTGSYNGAWLVHGPHAERREQPVRALSSPLQRNSTTTSSGSVTALQLALLLPEKAACAWISSRFVLPDMDGPPLAESEAWSLVQ